MARKLIIQKVEDESLWDDFVSGSLQGTPFSKSRWVGIAASVQGGVPQFLGVFDGEKLAAGLTFIELSRGPFTKITTPILTPYGGVVCRRGSGKRESERVSFDMDCAESLISYIGERYGYVFLVNSPGYTDIRPFIWAGWTESVRYTYILDLDDPAKIWDVMERRVRTVLRKAEESLTLDDSIDIEQFSGLYERIYSDRGNKPPVSSGMVRAFLRDVLDSGMVEIRTARDKSGKVISSMALVYGDRTVYSWISGSIPDKNSTGAFSLLFWDAVKRHSGNFAKLDMVGANIPSIAFFKKGFGGTLCPYYVTEKYKSLFSRIVFGAYGNIRKVLPV